MAGCRSHFDFFIKKFPFGANITTIAVSLASGATSFSVPSDFIQDYYNGIVLDNDQGRLVRRGLGAILNRGTTGTGKPTMYSVKGSTIHIWPKTDKAYTGTLYYYQLPAVLAAATVPAFPDDLILVEYVWIKAQEWQRLVPPGTAMKFANDRIAELQRSGVGNEAEEDQLPIDPHYASQPASSDDWMGPSAL